MLCFLSAQVVLEGFFEEFCSVGPMGCDGGCETVRVEGGDGFCVVGVCGGVLDDGLSTRVLEVVVVGGVGCVSHRVCGFGEAPKGVVFHFCGS